MWNPSKLSDSSDEEELDADVAAGAMLFASRFDPVPNVNNTDYVTVPSPGDYSGYYPEYVKCSE